MKKNSICLLFITTSFSLFASNLDIQKSLREEKEGDEIFANSILRKEGISRGYAFCDTKEQIDQNWKNILLAAGYFEKEIDGWHWNENKIIAKNKDIISNEIFLPKNIRIAIQSLYLKVQKKSVKNEKYFFPKEEVEKELCDFLVSKLKGIEISFDNGVVVTIRYNKSQEYVLYLVENDIKYFELQ